MKCENLPVKITNRRAAPLSFDCAILRICRKYMLWVAVVCSSDAWLSCVEISRGNGMRWCVQLTTHLFALVRSFPRLIWLIGNCIYYIPKKRIWFLSKRIFFLPLWLLPAFKIGLTSLKIELKLSTFIPRKRWIWEWGKSQQYGTKWIFEHDNWAQDRWNWFIC